MELKVLKEAIIFDTGNATINQNLKQEILDPSDCFGKMYEASDPQCRSCTARAIYLGEEHAIRDLCEMQCQSSRVQVKERIEAASALREAQKDLPLGARGNEFEAKGKEYLIEQELESDEDLSSGAPNDGLSMRGSMDEEINPEAQHFQENQGDGEEMARVRRQQEDVSELDTDVSEVAEAPRRRGRPPMNRAVSTEQAPARRGRPPKVEGGSGASVRATAPKAKPVKSAHPAASEPPVSDPTNPFRFGTDSFYVYHVIKEAPLTPDQIREAVVEFEPKLQGKKIGIYNCLNALTRKSLNKEMIKGHKLVRGENEAGRVTWFIKVD